MKYRLKNGRTGQAGFTLLEVLIALAILGVMGAGATAVVGQTFQQNGRTTNAMQVIEQVENVGYWINHDALMAQTITPSEGSGFPLELSWQDTVGHTNQVTYAISGDDLQRSLSVLTVEKVLLSSKQSMVASNINSDAAKTNCSYASGILNFQATSTIGTSSQTRSYQIKIRIDQPSSYLTITTPSLLPSIYYSVSPIPYSQALEATGGTLPNVWSISSGDLPTGLSISSGAITGTPLVGTSFDTYNFSIQVTDSANRTAVKDFTIFINPLTITTASLPNGQKLKDYGKFRPNSPVYLTATGGTTIWTSWLITAGNLPPGLSLGISNGLISGTPNDTTGNQTYSFTVTLTDSSSQMASKNLSIHVDP